jgi:hypothetical protein
MAVCHTGSDTTMHLSMVPHHQTGSTRFRTNIPVSELNLYFRHIHSKLQIINKTLPNIIESYFKKLFKGKVMNLKPKLKCNLPAQNVFRIQQATVQILLRTVLLFQLTSENLKQEISYYGKLLCLLHFLLSNTSKTTTQTRFVAQYFQFIVFN